MRRMMDKLPARLLVAVAGLVAAIGSWGAQAPPNIVILFADDLGYGDLGCYGHPTIETPNLDRMAANGLRLTSFYSGAAVCSPARAALLSGRYPLHAGMPFNTGPDSEVAMDPATLILPQILRAKGYKSMAVGKWHLGHHKLEQMPVGRGFDFFFGLPYSNDMIKPWVQTERPLALYRNEEVIQDVGRKQEYLTVRYTEAAISFIDECKIERVPFLLYLAYSMPHLPIFTVPEREGRSRSGLYGDVIETIDWSVGRILRHLEAMGIADNTLVLFTSDNGPWQNLPDRMLQGGNERWHGGSSGMLRGAKMDTFEGGFRVPAIFHWPGTIPEGTRSADIVSAIDVLPTAVAAAGAALPDGYLVDGFDLNTFLKGRAASPRTEFLYSKGDDFEAIREGPWKLRVGQSDEAAQLFHLDRDPSEFYDVADRYPDLVRRLRDKLESEASRIRAAVAGR